MAKLILMDELHVGLFAPPSLTEAEYDAMHQILAPASFQADLVRLIRQFLRRHPSLGKVRVKVSR